MIYNNYNYSVGRTQLQHYNQSIMCLHWNHPQTETPPARPCQEKSCSKPGVKTSIWARSSIIWYLFEVRYGGTYFMNMILWNSAPEYQEGGEMLKCYHWNWPDRQTLHYFYIKVLGGGQSTLLFSELITKTTTRSELVLTMRFNI